MRNGLSLGWAAALILAVCTALVAFLAAPDPISWDGIAYIEAARSLVDGRGLMIAPQSLTPLDQLVPLELFPPGFSLVTAGVHVLGPSAAAAAMWVTRLSWVALPLCSTLLFRSLGLRPLAVAVLSAIVTFSPGVIESGLNVHSDILFLDLVLVSTWGLVTYARTPANILPLVLSGVLAGAAYAIRNAGVAFLGAGATFFFAFSLLGRLKAPIDTRGLLVWVAAAAPVVLAVKLRALFVLGAFEPYTMPPSDVGLFANVRWFLFAALSDLTAARPLGWLVWDKISLGIMLVGFAGIAWRWGFAGIDWLLRLPDVVRRTALMLIAYCVAGAAMLVITRTLYDWQAIIDERYATQYTWAVLALVGLAWPLLRPAYARLLTIACGGLIVTRVVAVGALFTHPFTPILSAGETRAAAEFIADVPANAVIVSNEAATVRLATGRDIRQLGARGSSATSLLEALAAAAQQVSPRPLYAAFVASDHEGGVGAARAGEQFIRAQGRLLLVAAARPDRK